jgi:cation:H+ antiporter
MIIVNLVLFLVFMFILIKCASYAIRYSSRLAKILRFPEFVVSFFIIALISAFPEATISIISAINGEPELGLGTLLGSNVADLTLVFGIVALFSSRGIKVKSKILKDSFFYLILLLFPLILGFDGKLSRVDGAALILSGFLFFVHTYVESKKFHKRFNNTKRGSFTKSLILLIISLAVLLASAYFTVKFAVGFAYDIKLPPILIGITILAIGTCLPELIFSIRAVKKNHDELALGDILGTVITDATIILGLVALISPFNYNPFNIYITGGAMFLAGFLVIIFMKSEKSLSKLEGVLLLLVYVAFVIAEFFINSLLGLG